MMMKETRNPNRISYRNPMFCVAKSKHWKMSRSVLFFYFYFSFLFLFLFFKEMAFGQVVGLLLVCTFWCSCVWGDCSYYVSPSGSDGNNGQSASKPFQTIGKALSVDDLGPRTVCLMSGTYPSEGNSNLVFMDDPLIFLALDGQGSVQIILDNEDIFLVYNGPDFQMSNVSLKGGNQILDVTLTTTNDVSFKLDSCFINHTVSTVTNGGPIFVTSPPVGVEGTASVIFENCQMSFNEAKNASAGGGAVTLLMKRPASVLFEGCVFNNNEATNSHGGALSISLLSSSASSPPLPSNLTLKCSSSGGIEFAQLNRAGRKGGFLYYTSLYESSEESDSNYILVENCQIGNNTAGEGGGAMWVQNVDIDIHNANFFYNSGGKGKGGGVYVEGNLNLGLDTSLSSSGPSFIGNSADEGGAIFLEKFSSDLIFSSLNLGDNTCAMSGGGEVVIWSSVSNNNTVTFSNNTFKGVKDFAVVMGNNTQGVFQNLPIDSTTHNTIFPSLCVGEGGQVFFQNDKTTSGLIINYLALFPTSYLSSGGVSLSIDGNFVWEGGLVDSGATAPLLLTINPKAEMTVKAGGEKYLLKNFNLNIQGELNLQPNQRLLFEGGTSLSILSSGSLNLSNNTSIAPSPSPSPSFSLSLSGTLSSSYSALYGDLVQNEGKIIVQKNMTTLSSVFHVAGSACLNGTVEMNYFTKNVPEGEYGLVSYESLPCEPKIVKINNFNGKFTSTSNSSLVYVTVLSRGKKWALGGGVWAALATATILFLLLITALIIWYCIKKRNSEDYSTIE